VSEFDSAFKESRRRIMDLRARGILRSGVWAMASRPPKLPEDATDRAHQMPRNSALLYRNTDPKGVDPAAYRGLLKMADGRVFWVGAWPRLVKGKTVVELRLVERKETAR
jgi:hypothetical protein